MDAQDEQDYGIDSREAREGRKRVRRQICLLSDVGAALRRDCCEVDDG